MTKEKKHQNIQRERRLAMGVAVFATVLIAAAAGLLLALFHMDRGLGDLVYAMTYTGSPPGAVQQSTEAKIEETQAGGTPMPALSANHITAETVQESYPEESEIWVQEKPESTPEDSTAVENTPAADAANTLAEEAAPPVYPQDFQLVDESYFDDALFIGDSRMEGFGLHSGLKATFYAATGLQLHEIDRYKVVRTEAGKVPIFTVMQPDLYKKVYIKVGLNELGWGTDEQFLQEYADLIARVRELEPGAIIYVHGLIHVTAAKSQSDPVHTNEKINARNAMLQQFALEQQAYYVDINEVVSDADGALLPDLTSDGIHLKAQYMELWKNYLMAHAVVVPAQTAPSTEN